MNPIRRYTLSFALSLLLCASASAHAAPVKAQHLSVDLISDSSSIAPNTDFHLGLHFILDSGWHVYWQNAGDSGLPPEVKWHTPDDLKVGAIQFPVPRRLPLGPLMDYGYEGQVLFPMRATYTGASTAKPLLVTADVRWLVCRESCIPGKATLSITLPVGSAKANAATAELFRKAQNDLPMPLPGGATVTVSNSPKNFIISVHDGKREDSAEVFPFDAEQIANAAPQPAKPLPNGIQISVPKTDTLQIIPTQFHGLLKLPTAAYEFQAPVTSSAETGSRSAANEQSHPSHSVVEILGLAFLGGILLNLMPCVFPVLFLKGLALVSSSAKERKHMRAHGLVYTLGILVSFWAIVVVLLVLRAGGSHLGWGFQFQSPCFVAAMAALLFFLGLSLAGQFDIGLTLTSAGGDLAQRGGYSGSFFTGVLATIVATPCTGPFMGAAIGYALSQSALVTLLIFTALALGLALPYLLLALQPSWTRLLPKPGAWMEYLKVATAVPIFATVIWLVWLFTLSAGTSALIALLACFVVLGIAGWVLGRWPARATSSVAALVLAAVALALPLISARHPQPASATTSAARGNWQPYSAAAFNAARSQGKAVFVDFTAQWCLSCQVNERVVLTRPEVQAQFAKDGIVLMKADWTRQDPEITSALAALGRSGVPAYALYANGAEPRLLPEVLTPGIVLDALAHLDQNTQSAREGPQ